MEMEMGMGQHGMRMRMGWRGLGRDGGGIREDVIV